ncbi:MarR family winged helix-turn-helix transcriptional regulator [Amycolatopsis sp. NPDC059657]|uniref:MarR family winged helix-turn-helix transcriptional regulator n=1 Tax=Amycolatopsis sp. NPDC059657 TaxID=3346899 RepID=UPI0036735790
MEDNTPALLYLAYLRLSEEINEAGKAADPDVRPAHATVFINMEHDGIRLTKLAEKAVMTPQAMGELVDDLEKLGYLRRVPDPSDRRAKLIVFTERGERALDTAFAVIGELEQKLRDFIGVEALERVHRALRKIIDEY